MSPLDVARPEAPLHPLGYGVGVGTPRYLLSIARRTSTSAFPWLLIAVTSRVTSRQIVHVAAWLVKVSVPSGLNDLM